MIQQNKDYPPYNKDGDCQKCGNGSSTVTPGNVGISTTYHEFALRNAYERDLLNTIGQKFDVTFHEFLERQCRRCGYSWREKVLSCEPLVF